MREVAERAGVSRAAVSRTFTPGASVSARTREKVERARGRSGLQPQHAGTQPDDAADAAGGVVSNNFRNPVFLQIFDLFTRAIQDRGCGRFW